MQLRHIEIHHVFILFIKSMYISIRISM